VIVAGDFADAHAMAVLNILASGSHVSTDYDKPDEPESMDIPMMIEVTAPWEEPVYFSKCVWGDSKGLVWIIETKCLMEHMMIWLNLLAIPITIDSVSKKQGC